ncbi:MAG: glycosyltransferase family 2 protein [Pseudomonadota bacterium]
MSEPANDKVPTSLDSPDVSVIIAGYKAEGFVHHAIGSALSQDGVGIEVILVDDCSPDGTAEAARAAFPDEPRLFIARLSENGGPSAARNHGLSLARGRYYAVLDADDTFSPGRLAHLVEVADAGGYDLVADNMAKAPVPFHPEAAGPFLKPGAIGDGVTLDLATFMDPLSDTRFGEPLGYLKPLFRRATLEAMDLAYDTALRNSEDYYLVAEMLARGACYRLVPHESYHYTVQVGSESHRLGATRAQAILDAELAFVERHGPSFDETAWAASKRREKWIRKMRLIERVAEGLKAGRPVSAAMAVGQDPRSAPALVDWSLEVIRKRTG